MSRNRTVRRRRSIGALALGTAAVLVHGAPVPAGAQTSGPTGQLVCVPERIGARDAAVHPEISGAPANEQLLQFIYYRYTPDEGDTFQIDGYPIDIDEDGNGASPALPAEPPVRWDWVVYRDTNGNRRWDIDQDDNVFRGVATVTACPQTVQMTSK